MKKKKKRAMTLNLHLYLDAFSFLYPSLFSAPPTPKNRFEKRNLV